MNTSNDAVKPMVISTTHESQESDDIVPNSTAALLSLSTSPLPPPLADTFSTVKYPSELLEAHMDESLSIDPASLYLAHNPGEFLLTTDSVLEDYFPSPSPSPSPTSTNTPPITLSLSSPAIPLSPIQQNNYSPNISAKEKIRANLKLSKANTIPRVSSSPALVNMQHMNTVPVTAIQNGFLASFQMDGASNELLWQLATKDPNLMEQLNTIAFGEKKRPREKNDGSSPTSPASFGDAKRNDQGLSEKENDGSQKGEKTMKKRRGNLPKSATSKLKAWLFEHVSHPYPSEEEKVFLSTETGLNLNQICNWFINARRRIVGPISEQLHKKRRKINGLKNPEGGEELHLCLPEDFDTIQDEITRTRSYEDLAEVYAHLKKI